MSRPRIKFEPGERFGRLVVQGPAPTIHRPNGGGLVHCWQCVCDCGKSYVARTGNLQGGTTRSCGCLKTRALRRELGMPPVVGRAQPSTQWVGCEAALHDLLACYGGQL